MSVGTKIRDRRKLLGMSQGELARLVGYADRTAISKIERGELDLHRDKVIIFAKALQCSPADFFEYNESEEHAIEAGNVIGLLMLDEKLFNAVSKLVSLPNEKKESIINMINFL